MACLTRLRTNMLVRFFSSSSCLRFLPHKAHSSVSSPPYFRVSSIPPSSSQLRFNPPIPFLPARSSSSLAASDAPSSPDLSITDSCVKRLQELRQEDGAEGEGKMLRVSVEGGGCSGFQYVFTLDDTSSTSDRVFAKDGVKVVVDEVSLGFLKGATIDYVEELIRSSFMVTKNPNASGGCGCGSSFNVM